MSAELDPITEDDFRTFRRYGIRKVYGIEQLQEEVITYVRLDNEEHNYTVELPGEDGWWLISEMSNCFAIDSTHYGHTPIFKIAPHLSKPVKEVKLITREAFDKALSDFDAENVKQKEEMAAASKKANEDAAKQSLKLKADLQKEVEKTGTLSSDSLLKLLDRLG